MFEWWNAEQIGRKGGLKGGLSRSSAKRRASRANGADGGRPRTRTLGEMLLRRSLNKDEHHKVCLAYLDLTKDERRRLNLFFFGQSWTWPHYAFDWSGATNLRLAQPNEGMRFLLKKLRLMARRRIAEP